MLVVAHDGLWKRAVFPVVILLGLGYLSGCAPTSRRAPPETRTPPRSLPEYFAEVKRRIEANWVYPQEAVQQNQSGRGTIAFVLRRNGSVKQIEITETTGVHVLDAYIRNAVLLTAPFPPFPDEVTTETLPLSVSFSYNPRGYRLFSP